MQSELPTQKHLKNRTKAYLSVMLWVGGCLEWNGMDGSGLARAVAPSTTQI